MARRDRYPNSRKQTPYNKTDRKSKYKTPRNKKDKKSKTT